MAITMKAARVNAGLTQEEAAKKLDISKATLLGYENGRTIPKVDVAQKMATLYRLTVNDIIFFEK
jgi:DNA-binding XRE family transcriptional regulator